MNIINLLTKEKRVAGIEISDSVVRIAFFHPHEKKRRADLMDGEPADELILIEEPIGANIISDGVVVDPELLGKTLSEIWSRANIGADYAIVAIPDDKIYSRIFSFPKSIEEAKLSEAMRLAITFQLPVKTEDAYLDWERVNGNGALNEILLSTIPKNVVQGYITALEKAGIKTLAMESHLAGIARAVRLNPDEITMFIKKTPDGATIFALENGVLRFSRTFPIKYVPESKLPEEISKAKFSLESGTNKQIIEKQLVDALVSDDYLIYSSISEPQSKWLIALGSAIRSKIPAGQDNLISLLPVGTEEAYAYQKAATVISVLRNMTIGVSVFFIIAYISAYLFIFTLSQNRAAQIATLSTNTIPPELLKNEATVAQVNALTGVEAELLAKTPVWSSVVDGVISKITDGITISSFSAPNIEGSFSLTGIASNRDALNAFKRSLQSGEMFTAIEIPIANLEKKDNIPFSATFRLKDLSTIYYK